MLFSIIRRTRLSPSYLNLSIDWKDLLTKINLDDEAATTGAMTGEGLAPGRWSRPRGLFPVISNLMVWWCGFLDGLDKNAPPYPLPSGSLGQGARVYRLGRVGVLTGTQVGTCNARIYQLQILFFMLGSSEHADGQGRN